ncbi:MAG TPA: alpha/beta hydrolase [Syntrophobacteraceae bacterium]|nr:alpha/beta hydrolase [Syntrophobacteraceae bacterium]
MKKKLALVALLVVLLLAVAYFLFPEFLFNLAQQANRRCAGLVKKEVQVDSDRIVYLEGGRGEIVLLLHGYTANKDRWTHFAKRLTPDYHVIIPDLAGFGESTKRWDQSYDIDSQVKLLDRFTEVLQLQRFHLAGNSMGGAVAAVYSAEIPQKILTVALLAPYGVVTAKKSEFQLQRDKGVNPLLIRNPADFERVLPYLFFKPPPIPAVFRKVIAAQAMAAREFNEKIAQDLAKERLALEPFLPMIEAPVLIIWGDHDRMLDVSGASILEKGLKNHQTLIMNDTGHLPMMEKPAETAAAYISFLKNERSM